MDFVTLVDEDDRTLGKVEKMAAHRDALLHRACSVVLFNETGELLLQKRNPAKYHSGGLWSNTCCTHPRPGETPLKAAERRLREEMGIDAELRHAFSFVYKADVEEGLVEHEYDHVFVGRWDAPPRPNAREVADWRWATMTDVAADVARNPAAYTRWFPLLVERLTAVDGG